MGLAGGNGRKWGQEQAGRAHCSSLNKSCGSSRQKCSAIPPLHLLPCHLVLSTCPGYSSTPELGAGWVEGGCLVLPGFVSKYLCPSSLPSWKVPFGEGSAGTGSTEFLLQTLDKLVVEEEQLTVGQEAGQDALDSVSPQQEIGARGQQPEVVEEEACQ